MLKIFTNRGGIMEHQVKKDISPLSARKILEENMKREKAKAEGKGWYGLDRAECAKNYRQYKKDYDRTLPEKLRTESKNELWKRAKFLKEKFTVGMLSKDELHPVKSFKDGENVVVVVDQEKMRSTNAVKRNASWNRANEASVREYKNIMRHLCPENPSATDIEKFRPRGRIK